ncbi:MAG: TAXI family TRAP transporter solute-binding subunit [Syntrophales bacterium]
MKKLYCIKVLSVAIVLSFSLFVMSAGAQDKLPRQVSIGTHSIGAFLHTIGVAAAKTISDHTSMKAIVKPMVGPVAWFPYMERGDIDLGVLNMWDAEKGYLGESSYAKLSNNKGFSVRLLCSTVPNTIGVVVAKDSPIKTMSDLKGKRFSGNFPIPSVQLQNEALLASVDLTWKDIVPVAAHNPSDGVSKITDGRSDAASVTLGTPTIDELNAKKGARFLTLNNSKEAVAKIRKFFPGYMVKVQPGPGKTGIEKESYLWSYDIYLVAGEKLSEEAAYASTKALWENAKDFVLVHKLLKDWVTENFVSKEATIPYHPGAIKFYKEKGVWTADMDKLQSELLAKKK